MQSRILNLNFLPTNTDAGLLVLRVLTGVTLYIRHGYEKMFHFTEMANGRFRPDDIWHIGVVPTLVIAMLCDSICSVLIILGVAARWASLYSFTVIFVAWAFRHHFAFLGGAGEHGEVIMFYLAALLTLFMTGPGRFSVDARVDQSQVGLIQPGKSYQA